MIVSRVFRRIDLNRILFLTDFTEPSDQAIPYVASFARGFESEILTAHVITDVRAGSSDTSESLARAQWAERVAADGMARVHSQLSGLNHESLTLHRGSVWEGVRELVEERNIDLIVAGSHRRTWADGLMHDSIAEEIFRRASVPVLVIGPHTFPTSHNAGAFRRILFATDFSAESQAATPFAVSLAEQNDAKLFVLHVLPKRKTQEVPPSEAATAAHVMHSFYETMPADVELWCRPEVTLRFGDPAPEILEAAADLRADLVVLGVRRACCGKCAHAKLPGITIARTIVAGARCPVLAVRQPETRRQIFRVNSLLNTEHRV